MVKLKHVNTHKHVFHTKDKTRQNDGSVLVQREQTNKMAEEITETSIISDLFRRLLGEVNRLPSNTTNTSLQSVTEQQI